MDLNEKKLALFDAHLSHKGLQHLVDTAAGLLGNPIFMADLSMGIVFKSSDMGSGELDFSAENDLERQLSLAKQAADAGYLDWIYHHDEPVIGTFEGQPRYLSARVRDGVQVLGHVVVSEAGRPFDESDKELLPVVCQTIAFELRRVRQNDTSSVEYGPLLEELLAGVSMDEGIIRKRMSSMGHTLPATLRVLLFRPVEATKTISLAYLRSQLLHCFHGSIGIVREGEVVHIVDGSISVDKLDERLRSHVYTGGLAVGSSWETRGLAKLRSAYDQADAAIRLQGNAARSLICPYDDVIVAHAGKLAFSTREGMVDALVLPQLRVLMEFDDRDGTDYVESLAAYLNSGRSVAKAAQTLHVHKNSIYYRLQRIRELAGIDVEDERTCFLSQFSLALMGMGPKASF